MTEDTDDTSERVEQLENRVAALESLLVAQFREARAVRLSECETEVLENYNDHGDGS